MIVSRPVVFFIFVLIGGLLVVGGVSALTTVTGL